MAQVFDGITVLDFSCGRAGGVATMVMSDFGAEVIKVEPPGGEKFRGSPGSIQWNRGKKSVVLDLKTQDGRDHARELARRSDVVVESFRPGVTRRLGIDGDRLRSDHPELVYATLTSFGPQGPYANYKGYDAVVAAKSGRMMMFAGQHPRQGPNYVVVQGVCHAAATALLRGITAALYVREKTGLGQRVETSMLKAVTTYDHVSWVHGQMVEKRPDLYPPDPTVGIGRPNPTGYLPARTKDGHWLQLGNVVERLFRSMMHWLDMDFIYEEPRFKTAPSLDPESVAALERIMLEKVQEKTLDEWMAIFLGEGGNVAAEPYATSCRTIGRPDLLDDSRFATPERRANHDDALAGELSRVFAAEDPWYWEKRLTAADVACVKAEDRGMYFFFNEDPHVRENGLLTQVEGARDGAFWRYSPVVDFSATSGQAGPGPLKGQHTRPILRELGYTGEQIHDLKQRKVVDWEEE